jgi:hypothetical protein
VLQGAELFSWPVLRLPISDHVDCWAVTEDALACLEKVTVHGTFYKNWAAKDSDLDNVRSDPRFQALFS